MQGQFNPPLKPECVYGTKPDAFFENVALKLGSEVSKKEYQKKGSPYFLNYTLQQSKNLRTVQLRHGFESELMLG